MTGSRILKSTTDPSKPHRGHRTAVNVFPHPGHDFAPADTSVPQVSQKNLAAFDFIRAYGARTGPVGTRDCQAS